MKNVFLSTAYLAPIEYYIQLANAKNIVIESQDNYVKQTYRNRCVIASSNGIQSLSIPISKHNFCKCLIRDVYIAENINWQQLHWNAIVANYSSTPFFQYYKSIFRPFYEKKQKFLYDFNEELRELICSLLGISPNIFYTSTYMKNINSDVLDLREKIHPKKVSFIKDFKSYYQVFEKKIGFCPNLSIIDLLFNLGKEAIFLLKR
ncbi:MAG: WbqC family protein [Bacteroidales bacterium OttesenSCG-928-I14]|nr:WbqC family protein [Bacteroidales bacterium OttesenSCG-928-I14]